MKHLGLTASLLTVMACSSANSTSNKRTAGLTNAADAAAGNQNSTTPASDPASSGTGAKLNNTALQALASKYDECTAAGKAWIPQTDSSKMAANPVGDCGADLVKFCCTLPKIQSLFAGSPDELASHVQPLLDKKFQIYDCSQETADQVKVHLIKFDGAAVSYTDLTLSGLLASDGSTSASSCQKPDMSVLLQSTGEASPAAIAAANGGGSGSGAGSGSGSGSGSAADNGSGTAAAAAPAPAAPPAVTFAANINPIVTASCGGATCHGAGAAQKVFVDSEATFKGDGAGIIVQLNGGIMPTGGKTISAGDKATLIKFLTP